MADKPVEQGAASIGCALSSMCERYRVERPQAHLAGHAVAHEPVEPGLSAKNTDLEIEAVAIMIETWLTLPRGDSTILICA
jgi:hypothetical protein